MFTLTSGVWSSHGKTLHILQSQQQQSWQETWKIFSSPRHHWIINSDTTLYFLWYLFLLIQIILESHNKHLPRTFFFIWNDVFIITQNIFIITESGISCQWSLSLVAPLTIVSLLSILMLTRSVRAAHVWWVGVWYAEFHQQPAPGCALLALPI